MALGLPRVTGDDALAFHAGVCAARGLFLLCRHGELVDGVARARPLLAGPRRPRRHARTSDRRYVGDTNAIAEVGRAPRPGARVWEPPHGLRRYYERYRGGGGGAPALSCARQRACNAPSPPSSPKSGSPGCGARCRFPRAAGSRITRIIDSRSVTGSVTG